MTGPGLDSFTDVLDYPMYVVTAAADGEQAGCLVGFGSQCSIDPPRFMVWISTSNRTYRVARRASHVAVHVLRREQEPTADWFGGRTGDDVDKFERVAWRSEKGAHRSSQTASPGSSAGCEGTWKATGTTSAFCSSPWTRARPGGATSRPCSGSAISPTSHRGTLPDCLIRLTPSPSAAAAAAAAARSTRLRAAARYVHRC